MLWQSHPLQLLLSFHLISEAIPLTQALTQGDKKTQWIDINNVVLNFKQRCKQNVYSEEPC